MLFENWTTVICARYFGNGKLEGKYFNFVNCNSGKALHVLINKSAYLNHLVITNFQCYNSNTKTPVSLAEIQTKNCEKGG